MGIEILRANRMEDDEKEDAHAGICISRTLRYSKLKFFLELLISNLKINK